MALYFIHQIIAYIPTYSGKGYGDVNIINIVAPILFIAITMQTKLGEKIHMLLDRLWDVYDGRSSSTNDKQQKQGQVRVTQPISGQQQMPSTVNPPPQLQSQMTNMKAQSHEFTIPQTPNFDNMYAGPETPLVGAANPQTGQIDNFEPMAANDGFGAFGTAF
jgi:chromosomal replication initiation ATPase DnaA